MAKKPTQIRIALQRARAQEQARHREMMLHPEKWPARPLLCVKRYSGPLGQKVECGVMQEGTTTVVSWAFDLLSPWEAITDPRATRYTYADVDAVMADKWVVD